MYSRGREEGVLLGILDGGVRPGSPNPDPISDHKMSFSTPVFRPGLLNPYPFSDHEVVTKRNIRVYVVRNYVIIAEIRTPAKRFLSFLFIYN